MAGGADVEAFHGSLLVGGESLPHLRGEIDDLFPGETCTSCDWHGRLHVPERQRDAIGVGRTYLLTFDDGRMGRVVIDDVYPDREAGHWVVEFHGGSALTLAGHAGD